MLPMLQNAHDSPCLRHVDLAALSQHAFSNSRTHHATGMGYMLMKPFVDAAGIIQPRAKGAVFWLMPTRIKLKAFGGLLKGRGPKKVVQPAVADPHEMGYSAFYAAVLSNVGPQVLLVRIVMCCRQALVRSLPNSIAFAGTAFGACLVKPSSMHSAS